MNEIVIAKVHIYKYLTYMALKTVIEEKMIHRLSKSFPTMRWIYYT